MPGRDPADGEPRRFRYTPTVSQPLSAPAQPLSAPAQAWPDDGQLATPGFEFDDPAQNIPAGAVPFIREPGPREPGPRQGGPRQGPPRQPARPARARAARVQRRGRGRI